ncbi:MAG: hypothetical protein ABI609_16220 [Acidobacteriota bacterium]
MIWAALPVVTLALTMLLEMLAVGMALLVVAVVVKRLTGRTLVGRAGREGGAR